MDNFTRAFYEVTLKLRFLESRGQAFQDFFADLMSLRYPGDFQRVKPWGRQGDWKNDGYLASERMLFQCYAPSELEASATTAKMEEDFEGAVASWRGFFEHWVFVSGELAGLPAPVHHKVLELDTRYAEIVVTNWGFEPLRLRLFELPDADVAALIGPAPGRLDVAEVRYADLEPLLDGIASRRLDVGERIDPVDPGKLQANALSESVGELLTAGQLGVARVEAYFHDFYDPRRGDEVATRFHDEYVRLRRANLSPDSIFMELRRFAGGPTVLPPQREAAIYALLAYLFQRCDIFEPARGGVA